MDGSRAASPEVLPPRPRRTPLEDGGLRLAAPAKLNLDLWVGPRRHDGYHPLDSIVVKVTLYDDITLQPRDDGEITFRCRGADCGPDEKNLALLAARLVARNAAPTGGVDILLSKSIPPGKGLGGGSSDAAAVLEGLNELWALSLPAGRLAEMAAELGSDVPLFLGPRASRMRGRGEVLQPAAMHPFVALLHMPELTASSAEVYGRFDSLPGADRPIPRRALPPVGSLPASRWRDEMPNELVPAAVAASDEFARTMARLADLIGRKVSMTGTGTALFVLCDDAEEAAELIARLPLALPGRTVLVRDNPW